jgi:hypothetical protein
MNPLLKSKLPLMKKVLLWMGGFLLLWGVLAGFVIPYFAPKFLANLLSEKLHRPVTIKQIDLQPYAMTASVKGFSMMEPDKSAIAASFDEIFVNLQAESIFRLAPVVQEVKLTGPHLNIIRNADGSYNFTDLIKEFLEQPDDDSKPKFAVFNIQLQKGRIDFDDRIANQKHVITDIHVGIPFFSNLPSQVDAFVQPSLAAEVDGAPFMLKGKTRPFRNTREATLDINLHELDLARYFDYLPVATRFKLDSGKLDSKLVVSFIQPERQVPAITVAGAMQLRALQAKQQGGQPLLKLPELSLVIQAFDVLKMHLAMDSISIRSPELTVQRNRDGSLNLTRLVAAEPAKPEENKADDSEQKKPGFGLSIGEFRLTDGTINFNDEVPSKPFKVQLREFDVAISHFDLGEGNASDFTLAIKTASGATLQQSGKLSLSPLRVAGKLELQSLRISDLAPYYQGSLPFAIEDGMLKAATRYDLMLDGGALKLLAEDTTLGISKLHVSRQTGKALSLAVESLSVASNKLNLAQKSEMLELTGGGISSSINKLKLQQPGADVAVFAADSLGITGGELDLGKKTLTVNEFKSSGGKLALVRNQDGSLNLSQLLQDDVAKPSQQAAVPPEAPWNIRLNRLVLDRYGARMDDHAVADSLPVLLEPINLTVLKFSNARDAKPEFSLKAGVGKEGSLDASGTFMLEPLQMNIKFDAWQLGLVAVQNYFMNRFNALITSGAGSLRGDLALEQGDGAEIPFKVKFQGALGITDFNLLDKNNSKDLAKWKTLALDNVQVGVNTGSAPYDIAIGGMSLNDFYARVILNEDGRLALRKLVKGRARDGSVLPDEEETPPAEAKPDNRPENADNTAVPVATAPAQTSPFKFRLDKLTLQGGDINFSDFFIKPNYSADLSELGGSISGLSTDAGSTADVDLRGKVNGTAPLEISGKVNPLTTNLFIDLKASAKGIELSGINPYATRYAGYAIEKGKLSVDIHYSIKDRKLQAENHVFLDQLTFGQKVESPDATKLPVTLAIALLKNSKGEIDINLPVQGSLDDPQFSIGGIIWKMIGNLIVKIITSPFALLGSLFGGGDQQLEYLEFDPGLATISKAGQGKLQTLAKALNDRPALKLDLVGRVDPVTDREGLKQAGLQYKVRVQKLKDTVKKGEDSASVDSVIISAEEWPVYLKQAYKEEKFPKPRNLVGFAKDLPPAEMEKLILANITVGEEDLRRLANQRAEITSIWLTKSGGIAAERVFVMPPKLDGEGIKDKGKPNRVDFSLK